MRKKDSHRQKSPLRGSSSFYGALSQQGLIEPIKPAYNQSRPDGQLKLTPSDFNQQWIWISMPVVLVAVPTVMQNLLHTLSTSSKCCAPFAGFYGAGKDNRGRHTDNMSGRHRIRTISALTSIITVFLC